MREQLQRLRAAVDDAAGPTQPPDFAELMARGRARRRRRRQRGTAAAGLVTAVVVLVVGGGIDTGALHGGRTPLPGSHPGSTHPRHRHPAQQTARSRLDALPPRKVVGTGSLYAYGSVDGTSTVTVWQRCIHDSQHCRYAWRLADRRGERAVGDAWSGGGAGGPQVAATAAGYVLSSRSRTGIVVDAATGGVVRTHPGRAEPITTDGTVAVVPSEAGVEAVDASTGSSWPLPAPPAGGAVSQALLAADAAVWALPSQSSPHRPGDVAVDRFDGRRWGSRTLTDPSAGSDHPVVPGFLALGGEPGGETHVAVLTSYDGATVAPVGVLAVSEDSGQTWRQRGRSQLPFATVDSMAADRSGTLYVADASGRVWRTVDPRWGRFTRVRGVRASGLQAAGEHVLAEVAARRPRQLALLDQQGVNTVPAR